MVGLVRVVVRRNTYFDSVTLLQISSEIAGLNGVEDAALVMGTDLNLQLLRDSGLTTNEPLTAGPNDLVVAVRAADDATLDSAHNEAEALLAGRRAATPTGGATDPAPPSITSAH